MKNVKSLSVLIRLIQASDDTEIKHKYFIILYNFTIIQAIHNNPDSILHEKIIYFYVNSEFLYVLKKKLRTTDIKINCFFIQSMISKILSNKKAFNFNNII